METYYECSIEKLNNGQYSVKKHDTSKPIIVVDIADAYRIARLLYLEYHLIRLMELVKDVS